MPYGYWELNLGPHEEQLVLLTAEPFLQTLIHVLKNFNITNQIVVHGCPNLCPGGFQDEVKLVPCSLPSTR